MHLRSITKYLPDSSANSTKQIEFDGLNNTYLYRFPQYLHAETLSTASDNPKEKCLEHVVKNFLFHKGVDSGRIWCGVSFRSWQQKVPTRNSVLSIRRAVAE